MSDGFIAVLSRRGVVAVGGAGRGEIPQRPGDGRYQPCGTRTGRLRRPADAAGQDPVRLHRPRATATASSSTCRAASTADFTKRIGFYRLRAKVTVADVSAETAGRCAVWGPDGVPHIDGMAAPDPRLAALGWRVIVPAGQPPALRGFAPATEADYDAHRIPLGIPEGGIDFAFGDAFPHDADMDQLAGVDFAKGCYIGQEVVSRMEHRGTARRRFVIAQATGALPAAGTELTAGGKALGLLGSSAGDGRWRLFGSTGRSKRSTPACRSWPASAALDAVAARLGDLRLAGGRR